MSMTPPNAIRDTIHVGFYIAKGSRCKYWNAKLAGIIANVSRRYIYHRGLRNFREMGVEPDHSVMMMMMMSRNRVMGMVVLM